MQCVCSHLIKSKAIHVVIKLSYARRETPRIAQHNVSSISCVQFVVYRAKICSSEIHSYLDSDDEYNRDMPELMKKYNIFRDYNNSILRIQSKIARV